MEARVLTQDLSTPEAFENTLKVFRLAMASAKVDDAVAGKVMDQLDTPMLKTQVLSEKEPLKRMAALWTALYEALESVGENDEVVQEWLDQFRWIRMKATPPTSAWPPYPREDPGSRN